MVKIMSDRDPLLRARELAIAGLLGALGLLLPIGFHALGWGGRVFLPMHLPILVAAFLVSPGTAISLAVVVPFLSAILTGMPPLAPPVAALMAIELAAKAGTASLLYRSLRAPMWIALPCAIIADWIVLGVAACFAADFFALKGEPLHYVLGVILVSMPGTVLQLVGVPAAVFAIQRRVPRLRLR